MRFNVIAVTSMKIIRDAAAILPTLVLFSHHAYIQVISAEVSSEAHAEQHMRMGVECCESVI